MKFWDRKENCESQGQSLITNKIKTKQKGKKLKIFLVDHG